LTIFSSVVLAKKVYKIEALIPGSVFRNL
jgi:hypothetical protein